MTETSVRPGPVVLAVEPDQVYGTFHPASAAASASTTAVLICPPWGWDEVTSYRSRRAWADRLAADGHPTVRIDLPATGDSGGSPLDPGRVPAWVGAIRAAAAWLANQPGVSRVAVIGLGLGGLLSGAAIAAGAPIDDLVLWAAPVTGRAFGRELRAFAGLQADRLLGSAGDDGSAPTPAILEAGGFAVTPETLADLDGLDLRRDLPGRLQRVLLLDRDGVRVDPAVAVVLRDRGVEVTEAAGSGWLDMVFHPEQYAPPLDVFDRVGAWLATAPSEPRPAGHGADGPERADSPAVRSTLEIDASGLRETPVEIGASFGRLFGILAEPAVGSAADLAVVFLNAGAVRRIGPNRMWVEAARRWTARGVATLRMDLEGIGDADGDPGRYRDVGNFYTPEMGAAVRAILDDLTERGLGRRVVLVGLCAGGYWAFHTAAEDPRVVGTLIINPRAMIWDPGLLDRREARKVERAIRGSEWRRVVRGEVPPARVLAVGRAVAVSAIRRAAALPATIRSARDEDRSGDPLDEVFGQLAGHGTRVVLAFSGDEPVHDELAADGVLDRLDQWPNVSVVRLPGTDHTVRPLAAQRAVHDLVDRELERICRGDTPRPVAPAAVVSAARSSLGQRRANDRVWTSGRHLGAYANRHLRPVEVVILARYREALSGSVLEIGSGAGRLTGYLAELGGTVLGIDVSTEMVGYSRRRYPDATFETRDLRDIAGLGSATFDAVFAPFNILDVVDDADRRRCLDAIHGVLRPDGLFVLSTHNRAVEARLAEPLRLPGRTIPDTVSRLLHRPIWQRNRNRLLPLERREADWAILNDPGHDFTVLHYYIDRDAQERQLAEHGFELIEVLDLQGRVVPRGAVSSSPELHYVARRRPLPRP